MRIFSPNRKTLTLFAATAMMLWLGIGYVTSMAQDATLTVVSEQTMIKGETFSALINVQTAVGMAGFQLDVSYNPAVIEAIDAGEGTFLSDSGQTFCVTPNIDNTAGAITNLACAKVGQGGVTGNGTLAIITFRAIGAGQSDIKLQNVKLSDSSLPAPNLISFKAVDGSVTVGFPGWDVNQDGRVDMSDLVLVGERFGESVTIPTVPNPDVYVDGKVDIFDLVIVGQHYGEIYSLSAPGRDISRVDPGDLATLGRMYNVMQDIQSSDPAFVATRELLNRLILSARVSKTEAFQNYPNPFNPETWIPYQLAENSEVKIGIYSSNGSLIRTLDLGCMEPGLYITRDRAAYWDGTAETGERVSSGVYFYSIHAGKYSATRKMIVVQ